MPTQTIDIVARNKAAASLKQVNTQLNTISRSANSINDGFNRLRNLALGVAAAVGGIKFAKGFLDTAVTFEQLGIQLKFITGSAKEGSKALLGFEEGVRYNAEQTKEIITKGFEDGTFTIELNQLLQITGDIATASGLDFVTAAEQIQRSFSGGIASADLFRERGVKALLGFEEGVRYNAEQTKEIITKGFEDGTFTIVGASKEMSETFTGQVSMIQDKFLQFQKQVMDTAPFDFLKALVKNVNEALTNRFGDIETAAAAIGDGIVHAAKTAMIGTAQIIDAVTPIFNFVADGVGNLIDMFNGLDPVIKSVGLIGFMLMGIKGKLLLVTISAFFDDVKREVNKAMIGLTDIMIGSKSFIANQAEKLGIESYAEYLRENIAELEKEKAGFQDALRPEEFAVDDENLGGFTRGLSQFSPDEIAKMGTAEKAIRAFLDNVDKDMAEYLKKRREEVEDPSTPKAPEQAGMGDEDIGKLKKNISEYEKAFNSRVKSTMEALMTEREQEERMHDQRIRDLKRFISINTELRAQGNEMIEREHERHAQAMKRIEQQNFTKQFDIFQKGEYAKLDFSEFSNEQLVDFTKKAGLDTLNALSTQNKKAFQLMKAYNLAVAIQNTALGVSNALGRIPFPFNLAVAGIIGAAGAVQIAAISNSRYQGRRFGGPVSASDSYIVGENGPELFTPGATGRITANDAFGDSRPVNVNFNIDATDARSVDELIVQRRAMITNMVRQAIQEKGNRPNF